MSNNHDRKLAGFWVRVLAFFIDALVCFIPLSSIEKLLGEDGGITLVVTLVLLWLYMAFMLSSSWQATIGKKILGLKVITTTYESLDFKNASIRFIYSLITFALLSSPALIVYLANGSFILWLVGIVLILLPILMMFFNEKKQVFHDYLAHTIVVDITQEEEENELEASVSLTKNATSLIRIFGITAIVLFLGYYLIKYGTFIAVMGAYGLSQERSYNASFHETYSVNDFNDSRIIFYNKELEKHSKEYVVAEGMYDIFEADVKKDLSLSCVKYFLRENNDTQWIETGSKLRKNARNKFLDNEAIIKNAKENERHMGHHFYDYDLNDVNDLIDDIANKWGDENTNKETCQKLLPADDMYKMFIEKYIYNREEALKRYKEELVTAPESGTLAKPFYRNSIRKTEDWLRLLYSNNPNYNGDSYRFNLQMSTSDITHISDILFVFADRRRGIELWSESNNTVKYVKTLVDDHKAYRVKYVKNRIFAFVKDENKISHLISYKLDNVSESIVETASWTFEEKLDLVDWDFLDNYTKVAMVFGYGGMRTFDISNPNKIKEILKRYERHTNYSRDIAISGDNVYESARRGSYVYDHVKKIRLKKEKLNSKKDPKIMALAIDDNKNIMYKLGAFFKTKSYMLYKYNIDGSHLSLLDVKKVDIDLTGSGVLGSRFPENMKVYKNRIFIAGQNGVYLFNEEMTMVKSFKAEGLADFKIYNDKIILFNYKGIIKKYSLI